MRRAGSAALDLANVACGRYDGFWEFNLNPWDTAAGVLLVQEAGGKVTRFDGSPFRLDSREVLATNGLIHQELLDELSRRCSPDAAWKSCRPAWSTQRRANRLFCFWCVRVVRRFSRGPQHTPPLRVLGGSAA